MMSESSARHPGLVDEPTATGAVVTTVTSPSLSSEASSLLHTIINSTRHTISSGLVPDSLNATTSPTPSTPHNLSTPNVSTVSAITATSTMTSSTFSFTTAAAIVTENVTAVNNSSLDSHSLPPHGLGVDHGNYLMHSLIIQSLLILCLMAVLFGVIYILRKKHLDRLRHHLMPVYNFDPSDDGEDWETELLDDQFVHSAPAETAQPLPSGQLKLDTGLTRGLRIQSNTSTSGPVKSNSNSMSPTAMSGLLSSASDSGSSVRRMYTSERDPVA